MAVSTHPFTFLLVAVVRTILLGSCSAEVNSQFTSANRAFEEQGSPFFFYREPDYPRDCSEVGGSCFSSVSSGVYLIKPDGYEEPFEAYCNYDIDAGGWTVIIRRLDGSIDFNRTWSDHKEGFGFLSGEFWLGNDKLSYLTNQAVYELRVDIVLDNGTLCNMTYDRFRINDEWGDYTLSTVGTFDSNVACRWTEQNNPFDCNPRDVPTSFTDCNDVYDAGYTQDGVYCIHPAGWNDPPFKVFCNMSIDGGSWTVFQRRVNGSTNFYRNWNEYKEGFGDVKHEFWLGNEKLYYMTQQATYEYRLDFVWSSSPYYNKYSNFRIDIENNKYRVTSVGTRTGNRADSLYNVRNIPFSTYDHDNDGQSYNCAEGHRSGWWHGGFFYTYTSTYCEFFQRGTTKVICSNANLNGDYNGSNGESIFDHSSYCNQKYAEMKIRRIS
ncbi:Ficolin-1 [Holothuria leucospilota]|uniref:Ficolin-1 n=1 Tax=Holothuria leucospilota TaxID=206669 RepID=A0A9Q1BVC5_HOLLE|nr:Ficolin-1 [Holothuria leucospilota]